LLPITIPIWLISLPFRLLFWLLKNPITWITLAVLLYIYWE
jgi:hypothetical protein